MKHEKGTETRDIVDASIRINNLSVFIALELSNNEAIKRAVEKGAGISLISEHVASEEVKRRELKPILLTGPTMKRKSYLIYHKDRCLSHPFQMVVNMVHQWASEYPKPLT